MSSNGGGTVIQRMGGRIESVIERWMPSPFLFAIILTYIVYVAGVLVEGAGPFRMLQYWNDGFWNLLTFAMQMVLILATGYALAYHPWVRSTLESLTDLPSTGRQSVVMVGVVAMVVAWIHWGLGLIVGAILAREMGRRAAERGLSVHYPLLCVAGYMGLGLTWHWGLAGSAPLLMNTPGNVFVEEGIVEGLIPTSRTIFSFYSLSLTVLGIAYAAVALYLLSPPPEETEGITQYVPSSQLGTVTTADGGGRDEREATDIEPQEPEDADVHGEAAEEVRPEERTVPADRIDNNRVLGGLIALGGVAMTVYAFWTQGLNALSLNVVNFGILFVGLALFTSPASYQGEFYEAVESTAGIILQFPFYAGIMGMMNSSGLSATMAETLIQVSTPATFPAVAWITAGIINLFVPSGGGEWAVIGGTIIQAAQAQGVPVGQAVVAYAVGDAHTNLFQPFWAIPLLGITGMRARDVFGYAATMLLLLIPFLAVALIFVPYGV